MPSLSEEITQLETTLTLALSELEALKEKVLHLELENATLIQHLSPYNDDKNDTPTPPQSTQATRTPASSDGLDALARLYAEGYHVCHPAFGQLRDNCGIQDCIYCLDVLKGVAP